MELSPACAAYGEDGVFGRTTVKVNPSPGDDTTSIVPPWAQTNSDRLGSMRRSRSSGLRSPLQRATLGYNSSPGGSGGSEAGICSGSFLRRRLSRMITSPVSTAPMTKAVAE